MTIRDALAEGADALGDHETETPRLDAALLLAHALGLSRERLYMDLAEPVEPSGLSRYRKGLERRISGEPVAWIVGVKEFWGLGFAVGPGVLCPRPDSETLVEASLQAMAELSPEGAGGSLHDCCCGPGTLALALAVERPDWTVTASDLSETAARYFHENNRRLTGARAAYTHADLMDGVDGPFDIIVSNPPYLSPVETADRRALGWREPALALDGGGSDGLDVIRRLIPRAAARLRAGGRLLLEASPLQMPLIRRILSNTGFDSVDIRRDLAGRDRVIAGRRTGER